MRRMASRGAARRGGEALFRRLAVGVPAGWMLLFVAVPGALLLAASLSMRGAEGGVDAGRWTLDNYLRLLDPVVLRMLWKSTRLALGTTLLCLAVGFPLAYVIWRAPARWRRMLLLLLIIPLWTNSLVRNYALIALLNAQGLVNTALLGMGIITEPLQLLYTEFAVFLGLWSTLLPFFVLPVHSCLEALDTRLLDAARDLGAGRRATFFRVTLPLVWPGVIAGGMFVFLPAMGMFYIPDVLGGGKALLLGNFIKNQFLSTRDWPFGAAASVALMACMAGLFWLYVRSLRRAGGEPRL